MTEFFQVLERADKTATLAINSCHCPASDTIWEIFSNKEIWIILYLAVIVLLFFRLGWKKALIVIASCILCVTACDQLANFTKTFFARLRPCCDEEMISRGLHMLEGYGNLYGFYSAHAANAMGFACCSLIGLRNDKRRKWNIYGWGIVIWGLLVGISRIFVGKHFLGDVIVGILVGALFGCALGLLAKWAISKIR